MTTSTKTTGTPRARLSLAMSEYDHVRDLTCGAVEAEGIELEVHVLPIAELFQRFTHKREWQVSEMSLAMYAHLLSHGDTGLVGIPVFTSRVFRLSSFYVRAGSPLRDLADLRGKRVGYPDWMHTAGVYSRGYLMRECGIGLDEIEWVQAGINVPGLKEPLPPILPGSVRRSSRPDRSLDDLLANGEIDAVMSSHAVASFLDGSGRTVRLVPDFIERETAHYKATGIFPIMHCVALRRDVVDGHPWAAAALFKAFGEAKRRSLARLADSTISRFPYPWAFAWAENAKALFGSDFWPYGVDANRTTLEAFLDMCEAQGVTRGRLSIEALFPLPT